MAVPMITHRDLVAFAADRVNLKRSEVDDQRAQVARLRDRIENKIAVSPGYGFVKALHCGSVAKGTALRSGSDRDLAVYVKAEKAPDETLALVHWVRDLVIDAYPAMRDDQIVASTNCVNVRFAGTGLEVDVVPVLYEGEPHDVGYLVSKDDGTRLRTSVRGTWTSSAGARRCTRSTSRSSSVSRSGGRASRGGATASSSARASCSSCCGST